MRWSRLLKAPAADARTELEAFFGTHIEEIETTDKLPSEVEAAIAGAPQPDQKVGFDDLRDGQASIAQLIALCGVNLPIDELILPPPAIAPAKPADCSAAIPDGNPGNDAACGALGRFKAFVMQEAIQGGCPALQDDNLDNLLSTYATFEEGVDLVRQNTPLLSSLIPVPGIELELRTGRFPATDTFSFVDFQEAESVADGIFELYKCKNRLHMKLVTEAPKYPDCKDPDDPGYFGDHGCPCADVEVAAFDTPLGVDGGFSDGAGSYAKHGADGPGQFCRDTVNDQLVCGKIEVGTKDFGICQACGVDTNIGCACDEDADCQVGDIPGEENLHCWGGTLNGWSQGSGTCLPSSSTDAGKEKLTEMPWFCLDNCDAIDGSAGNTGACYYDQKGYSLDHGTCVSVVQQCEYDETTVIGSCAMGGLVCVDDPNDPDASVCQQECATKTDCADLGFPDHYECDAEYGFEVGHCVPYECAGTTNLNSSYCALFR